MKKRRRSNWLQTSPYHRLCWVSAVEIPIVNSSLGRTWPRAPQLPAITTLSEMVTYPNSLTGLSKRLTQFVIVNKSFIWNMEQGESTASYRWTGWVLRNDRLTVETSGDLPIIYRGICRMYLKSMKKNRKMSTFNRLDLETRGSRTD